MRLFVVPPNTPILRVREGWAMYKLNCRAQTTGAEHSFELEEMVVDPLGLHTCATPGAREMQDSGYFGFKEGDGDIMLIEGKYVEVL